MVHQPHLAAFPADENALGGCVALVILFFLTPSPKPLPDEAEDPDTREEVAEARQRTSPRVRPARAPLGHNGTSYLPRREVAGATKAEGLHQGERGRDMMVSANIRVKVYKASSACLHTRMPIRTPHKPEAGAE